MKKHPPVSILTKDKVVVLRGTLVILDSSLAEFFGITTSRLNEAVKRNKGRFSEEFMFQLTQEEVDSLRSQNAIPKTGKGGSRVRPHAFTEMGCWTVSMILTNKKAEQIGKGLLKTFKAMKDYLQSQPVLPGGLQKLLQEPNTTVNILYPTGPINIQVGDGNRIEQKFNNIHEIQELLEKILPAVSKQDKALGAKIEDVVQAVKTNDKVSMKGALEVAANSVQLITGIDPTITVLKTALSALIKFLQ